MNSYILCLNCYIFFTMILNNLSIILSLIVSSLLVQCYDFPCPRSYDVSLFTTLNISIIPARHERIFSKEKASLLAIGHGELIVVTPDNRLILWVENYYDKSEPQMVVSVTDARHIVIGSTYHWLVDTHGQLYRSKKPTIMERWSHIDAKTSFINWQSVDMPTNPVKHICEGRNYLYVLTLDNNVYKSLESSERISWTRMSYSLAPLDSLTSILWDTLVGVSKQGLYAYSTCHGGWKLITDFDARSPTYGYYTLYHLDDEGAVLATRNLQTKRISNHTGMHMIAASRDVIFGINHDNDIVRVQTNVMRQLLECRIALESGRDIC